MSYLILPNKIRSTIFNENDVREKFVSSFLITKILEISPSNYRTEIPVIWNQGRQTQTKRCDYVIYEDDKFQKIRFIIDAKNPNEDLQKWIDQIDSYAFKLESPISILTNASRILVREYISGNKKKTIIDTTLEQLEQSNYAELRTLIFKEKEIANEKVNTKRKDKPRIINYRKTFRKIHTHIRSIDKLDPASSFDEFSKVLFIKIVNDKICESEKITTQKINVFPSETDKKAYINNWFHTKVFKRYTDVFQKNEVIKLSSKAFITILETLDLEFDLKDSLSDVKGRAFEEFLPSQLRGKGLGQFFTPRSIVEFMVDLADISLQDKVLDFAAGSGGFLIKAFEAKQKKINSLPNEFFELSGKDRAEWIDLSKKQIYGIDAEPRAVRTAKMNMLLWGDGNQIQYGNGLDTRDFDGNAYYSKEYDDNDKECTGVDVILANPPFGSKETNEEILSKYELANRHKENGKIVYSQEKSEILFIEKAFRMLKPNGRLLIVLPEGIFSNRSSRAREYILRHFDINLIVRLPKHTFSMSGVDTINTVIMIARKKIDISKLQREIKIQFASVNQIGYEPSGRIIGNGYKDSDLNTLRNKIKNGDFSEQIADPFIFSNLEFSDNEQNKNWMKPMVKFTQISFNDTPQRLDPTYHFFEKETEQILNKYILIPGLKKINSLPITEKDVDGNLIEQVYEYISVEKNNRGIITKKELVTIEDILASKSRPKRVLYNSILYNPYRINTGSIIMINELKNNLVTSNAYINFDVDETKVNKEYLIQLFKTPFIKYQIQVLASGSVRDNLSFEALKEIKIPDISRQLQEKCLNKIKEHLEKIEIQEYAIRTEKLGINMIFDSLFH